jgi:hypothetical protein
MSFFLRVVWMVSTSLSEPPHGHPCRESVSMCVQCCESWRDRCMGMTRVGGNGNRDVKRLSLLLGEGGGRNDDDRVGEEYVETQNSTNKEMN